MKREVRNIDYTNESLLTFLSSAMNVEFIYVILLSINGFMDDLAAQDSRQISESNNKMTIEKDGKGTRIRFDKIKLAGIE